jgi:thiopeptide-type bacteriocin biosynthesis protein
MNIDLAPAAVARVAAWSFDRLDDLRAPQLAASVPDLDDHPEAWLAFTRAYQLVLDTQRAHLARVTTQDPPFARALAASNPQLYEWCGSWRPDEPRNKRVRHLETTLYRYLARAVGRTEPCDAWAGVSEATWSEDDATHGDPTRATYHFSPDLSPFQQIIASLAQRPAYRRAGPWRLNPTLHRTAPQTWELVARDRARRLRRLELACDQDGDRIIIALALVPPASLDELIEHAVKATSHDPTDVADALEAYIDADVLVGGLALPPRFETPWQALHAITDRLDSEHRSAWAAALAALSTLAANLAAAMDDAPAAQIVELLRRAEQVVAKLADALSVALTDRPRTPLRCDLGAPLRLALGARLRARIQAAIDEYEVCHTVVLPAAALRRELAAQLAGFCGSGRPIAAALDAPSLRSVNAPATWQELVSVVDASSDLATRVSRWQNLLETHGEEVECDLRGEAEVRSPFATLMLGLRRPTTGTEPRLTLFGILDEVAPICARYQGMIGDSIIAWHRASVDKIERQCGVDIGDLLADATSANTLARPTFTARAFDLWGATPGASSMLGSELVCDPASGGLVLRVPSFGRPVVVSPFSSSDVAADALAATLVRSSFRDAPGAQFHAAALPVASELETPRFRPRVTLPCSAVIRPRRVVIAGAELDAFLVTTGARRYAAWCRLAVLHDWPPYVTVQRDHGAMVAMPTTSPLALEAVFEGARGHVERLLVQELDEPWVMLPDGRRHVVELAVPFARARHAWSVRDAAARERSWLQLEIAVSDADAARRALESIAPLVGDFFFMRKPPGLRIRIDCQVAREVVAGECLAAVAALERLRVIGHARVGRYEPETTLFGGPAAMAHVHSFFCADSRAWLALTGEPFANAYALPAAVLEELFLYTLDRSEAWDAWLGYQRLVPAPDPALAPPQLASLDMLERAATLSQRDVIRSYRQAASVLASGLLDVARAGQLGCGLRTLLPFVSLFTFHRWGIRGDMQARIAAALVGRNDPRPCVREETS